MLQTADSGGPETRLQLEEASHIEHGRIQLFKGVSEKDLDGKHTRAKKSREGLSLQSGRLKCSYSNEWAVKSFMASSPTVCQKRGRGGCCY